MIEIKKWKGFSKIYLKKFHLHENEFRFAEYSVEFMTTLNVETDPLIRNFVTKSHAMCVCVWTCAVCVCE